MADTVLPDPTTYGTVVHRLLLAIEDSTDPGRNPDAGTPENPTVTFTPPKDWVNYPDGVPDPFTLRPQSIVCDYDAQGYLRHVPPGTDPQDPIDNPEDYRGVRLVATDNAQANPHGSPYQVVYRDGEYKKVGYVHVPAETTVDLAVDMAQDGGGGVWIQVGPQGLSAYEVAVANGFVGTPAEWLASIGTFGLAAVPGHPGIVQVSGLQLLPEVSPGIFKLDLGG